jgi:hypothetical protein
MVVPLAARWMIAIVGALLVLYRVGQQPHRHAYYAASVRWLADTLG